MYYLPFYSLTVLVDNSLEIYEKFQPIGLEIAMIIAVFGAMLFLVLLLLLDYYFCLYG